MLCVALSFVFASASAASVVDGAQHSTKIAHEHGLHLSFDLIDGDHHGAHPDDGDHHDEEDGVAGDPQPGAGHHHSDAPVGTLASPLDTGSALAAGGLERRINGTANAKGVRPGGLERPPKPSANLS
jgi:hypothetical protein